MLRRIAPAVLTAAVLAASLTACSQAEDRPVDRSDCESVLGPGALSDQVVVLGGYRTEPQISIPQGEPASVSQRTIVDSSAVKPGSEIAAEGSIVSANFALYDQGTGDELFRSDGFGTGDSKEFFMVSQQQYNPLNEALRCTVAGERVVLALSGDESAGLQQQIGGTPGSSIVAVFDVEAVTPDFSASGDARSLPNGFPAVVTDENGQPGVVLPPSKAPNGSVEAVRIDGDGEEVQAGDTIIAQVLIVDWTGSLVQNTWADQGPQQIADEETAASTGVTFRKELTGKKVGSQVVITQGGDSAKAIVVDILAAG